MHAVYDFINIVDIEILNEKSKNDNKCCNDGSFYDSCEHFLIIHNNILLSMSSFSGIDTDCL